MVPTENYLTKASYFLTIYQQALFQDTKLYVIFVPPT
jgi:hypothetical protein